MHILSSKESAKGRIFVHDPYGVAVSEYAQHAAHIRNFLGEATSECAQHAPHRGLQAFALHLRSKQHKNIVQVLRAARPTTIDASNRRIEFTSVSLCVGALLVVYLTAVRNCRIGLELQATAQWITRSLREHMPLAEEAKTWMRSTHTRVSLRRL